MGSHESYADESVIVGRLGAAHGVRGWIRVASYTESPEHIFNYSPWRLTLASASREEARQILVEPLEWRVQQKGHQLVRLAEVDSRTDAENLRGADVSVAAACFPELEHGQYYWRDLIGLEVSVGRDAIGVVERLFETGANDVLVIRLNEAQAVQMSARELLVPCTKQVVTEVDLTSRNMTIEWDIGPDE